MVRSVEEHQAWHARVFSSTYHVVVWTGPWGRPASEDVFAWEGEVMPDHDALLGIVRAHLASPDTNIERDAWIAHAKVVGRRCPSGPVHEYRKNDAGEWAYQCRHAEVRVWLTRTPLDMDRRPLAPSSSVSIGPSYPAPRVDLFMPGDLTQEWASARALLFPDKEPFYVVIQIEEQAPIVHKAWWHQDELVLSWACVLYEGTWRSASEVEALSYPLQKATP